MLELILKLLDKLTDLSQEGRRQRRVLHDDFIFPVVEQLTRVHQQYVVSFGEYRRHIAANAPDFNNENPVFKEIESDVAITHMDRAKLGAMQGSLPPYEDRDEVARLIARVAAYVDHVLDLTDSHSFANMERRTILERLHIISASKWHSGDGSRADAAEEVITERMQDLQGMYAQIQEAYQDCKTQMLN